MPAPVPAAPRSRRGAALLAAGLGVCLPAAWGLLAIQSAHADTSSVPGTLSTTAVNTSSMAIQVPRGVRPTAITGVLTQPQIVNGGVVAILVNGRVVRTVPSTLYKKLVIPVSRADVVADGTIGFAVRSTGPAIGNVCRPDAGVAVLKKVALRYTGTETSPRTLAQFFPPASSRIDVLIDKNAGSPVQQAALVAVAALSSRYSDETDVRLTTTAEAPAKGVASQRAILLQTGRAAEITTSVKTAKSGVPTLIITATGDELAAAARAIALAQPGDPLLNDPDLADLTADIGTREPVTELSLGQVTDTPVSLSGFGQRRLVLPIPQDAFSSQISELAVHLEGSTSAVNDPDRARVDVRMNGQLVGSQALNVEGRLALDFTVSTDALRAVNTLELQLSAVTTQGAACAGVGVPPIEMSLDTGKSTLTATPGAGDAQGFQQQPQALAGSLPVAIRTDDPEGRASIDALEDAAGLVEALQKAAAYPLNVQLISPDAFLAGERSGVFVGATSEDALTLAAPLSLSSIRELKRPGSSLQITSQEPYAALEGFTSDGREVVMLGGWAPDGPPPPALSHRIVEFVTTAGWAALDGDLVLTDGSADPLVVDSETLEPEQDTSDADDEEENKYAKWFILGAVVLLVAVLVQIGLVIRSERGTKAETRDDADDDLGVMPD